MPIERNLGLKGSEEVAISKVGRRNYEKSRYNKVFK